MKPMLTSVLPALVFCATAILWSEPTAAREEEKVLNVYNWSEYIAEDTIKFINYILKPEVHAAITNKVFYANPNKESRKFIKPDVANNPTVFPSEAEMKNIAIPDGINNDIRRSMTRLYTSFKTGL